MGEFQAEARDGSRALAEVDASAHDEASARASSPPPSAAAAAAATAAGAWGPYRGPDRGPERGALPAEGAGDHSAVSSSSMV